MINNPLFFDFTPIRESRHFRVQETPVKYDDAAQQGVTRFYPNKKILINLHLNQGISMVRENFLVVEHGSAYQLGVRLFKRLFRVNPQIHKEYISQNSVDYSVDLISEGCKFVLDQRGYRFTSEGRSEMELEDGLRRYLTEEFIGRKLREPMPWVAPNLKDEYHPFLRISNYLRDNNSLTIELGFYRSRCTNGMLLGERSKMIFKQSYFVRDLASIETKANIYFDTYHRRMYGSMERMWKLLATPVPLDKISLMTYDIYEEDFTRRSIEERRWLQRHLIELTADYVEEIGANLNAALNVATDLSKRLETGRGAQNKLHRRAAQWMHTVTSSAFQLGHYLHSLEGIEERVMNAQASNSQEIDDIDL
jgi:hypothetical protein